jgi:hypothetical protein
MAVRAFDARLRAVVFAGFLAASLAGSGWRRWAKGSLAKLPRSDAHVIAYADGEVRQEFNITYLGRVTGGTVTVSHESTEVRFIDPTEFDHIPIHDTVRLRLRHHAEHRQTPYLG